MLTSLVSILPLFTLFTSFGQVTLQKMDSLFIGSIKTVKIGKF